jgi:hypothetical protein
VWAGGCASGPAIAPGSAFEVGVQRAPFYKYGPAQSFGADESLDQGTRVTMLKRDMGFSRVMLADGTAGYVANDDLRPIAEGPATSGRIVPRRRSEEAASSGPIKRSNVAPTPGEPLFDVNDVPLPAPDTSAQKPTPEGQ